MGIRCRATREGAHWWINQKIGNWEKEGILYLVSVQKQVIIKASMLRGWRGTQLFHRVLEKKPNKIAHGQERSFWIKNNLPQILLWKVRFSHHCWEPFTVSRVFYPKMDHNHFPYNAAAVKYSHHSGRGQPSTDQQDDTLQLVRERDRKEGI